MRRKTSPASVAATEKHLPVVQLHTSQAELCPAFHQHRGKSFSSSLEQGGTTACRQLRVGPQQYSQHGAPSTSLFDLC